MKPPKEHNNFSGTNPKEREIYVLNKTKFKIVALGKLSNLQRNKEKQLKKIRKQHMNKMRSLTERQKSQKS